MTKQIELRAVIPQDATNLHVAEQLSVVMVNLLDKCKLKGMGVKVIPEKKEVIIIPYVKIRVKDKSKMDDYSCIDLRELKDEEDRNAQMVFVFMECIIDFWTKYAVDEFLLEIYGEKSMRLHMNKGLDKREMKKYFVDTDSDGWNVQGKFWERDWLRDDKKIISSKGGKL
jgi:hypothetical protein